MCDSSKEIGRIVWKQGQYREERTFILDTYIQLWMIHKRAWRCIIVSQPLKQCTLTLWKLNGKLRSDRPFIGTDWYLSVPIFYYRTLWRPCMRWDIFKCRMSTFFSLKSRQSRLKQFGVIVWIFRASYLATEGTKWNWEFPLTFSIVLLFAGPILY